MSEEQPEPIPATATRDEPRSEWRVTVGIDRGTREAVVILDYLTTQRFRVRLAPADLDRFVAQLEWAQDRLQPAGERAERRSPGPVRPPHRGAGATPGAVAEVVAPG